MQRSHPSLPDPRPRPGSPWRAIVRVGVAVTMAAVVAAPSAALAATGPSSQALTLSPQSGTPDASPTTQISMLGVAPGTIRSVTVTGSVSGAHAGQIKSYSDDSGASFVPRSPFTAGETVSVTVKIAGERPVHDSFTVGSLVPLASIPTLDVSARQPDKLDHFLSRPDLLPPHIAVSMNHASDTGEIFLTPLPAPTVHPGGQTLLTFHAVGPGGPMLLDHRGRTEWFDQLPTNELAGALQPARYENQPVLTWWQGTVKVLAFGDGHGVIVNRHYKTIATVNAGNGYAADIHEFQVSPSGDALLSIYQPIHPAGWKAGQPSLIDAIIQQVDIKTGLVKWEWHALGHIDPSDSYVPASPLAFDPFHLNSIQAMPDGTIVASMRDQCAIYRIDMHTGRILWTLGGRKSSFKLGRGASFYFQHDARMLGEHAISMFDDESGPPILAPTSRGLVLSLDTARRTARLVGQYVRPQNTLADSEGSTQALPRGDVFVGFGSEPNFSEFSPGGRMTFDAALPIDDGSYRVLRGIWNGAPRSRPDVAAVRTVKTRVTVYASWNGATDVAGWRVLAGPGANTLSRVGSAAWNGFETSIPVSTAGTTIEVQALDSNGKVLATSNPVSAR